MNLNIDFISIHFFKKMDDNVQKNVCIKYYNALLKKRHIKIQNIGKYIYVT